MTEDPKSPCERYSQLDQSLRDFLESMDADDVRTARDVLKTYRNASIVGRFMKWMIITAFVVFMGAAGILEKIAKFFGFKFGNGP